MNFSVLISVYIRETSANLNRALTSIWDDQYLKPNQIVIVKDGPLKKDLIITIEKWKNRLNEIIEIVSIKVNVGLGDALNIGLNYCKFDLVARMDSDDISLPNRFSTQIPYFKNNPNIAFLSAHVREFKNDENKASLIRKVPIIHKDIFKTAKMFNPINHPVVVYRKTAVQKSGGIINFIGFEDYFLWVRLLINDYKSHNIDEVLLLMRTGNGFIERRTGLDYAINEFKFKKQFINLILLVFFNFFLM